MAERHPRAGAPSELRSGATLAAICSEVVALTHKHLGKGPEKCRSWWAGDDMLVVMLFGGFTAAEETLRTAGYGRQVVASRAAYHDAIGDRLCEVVQRLSGRRVDAFMSAARQDPDMTVEIFVLCPALASEEAVPPADADLAECSP